MWILLRKISFETLPHITVVIERRWYCNSNNFTALRRTTLRAPGGIRKAPGRPLPFRRADESDLLIPWLRVVKPTSCLCPGSIAGAGQCLLIERLKLKDPNPLVISKNSAGLRQTFFRI
jgi:hypothetical protein